MDNLTTKQVMDQLKVSRMTMHRLLKRGEFPNAFKLGLGKTSNWRIPSDDVQAYIKRHEVQVWKKGVDL